MSSYVFFTKNGRLIPDKELNMDHINTLLAQTNQPLTTSSPTTQPNQPPLAALLFPAVSFHSPSESIQATFHPPTAFLFDLPQYEAELRDRRWQLLAAVEDGGKSGLLSLVREYLLYWGYDGTVGVLDENEVVEVDAKLRWTAGGGVEGGRSMAERMVAMSESGLRSSLRLRGEVRQLIQSADVEGAVRRLRHDCPAVLRQRTVRFHLHSLQFINILTTQQPTTPQSQPTTPPSSILAALLYARRHLSRYLQTASLSRLLGRLMALLAAPPAQWSASRLTGVEWREHVADVVNTAMLGRGGTSTTEWNGSGKGAMEDVEELGEEKGGKGERRESGVGKSERKNGMEVEEDALSGLDGDDSEQDEEANEEDEADSELHGSQLEMLLAQLLAVNSLWQHQRPSLSNQPLFPHDDVEQLLMPH